MASTICVINIGRRILILLPKAIPVILSIDHTGSRVIGIACEPFANKFMESRDVTLIGPARGRVSCRFITLHLVLAPKTTIASFIKSRGRLAEPRNVGHGFRVLVSKGGFLVTIIVVELQYSFA